MATNQTKVIISAEDKTGAALASVQKSLKGLEGSFAGLDSIAGRIPLLGSALTAAFGSISLTGLVKSTIDAADNLNDLSQRIGINIRDLATWDLAARQSGTSLESVAKGVKGLSTFMVENGAALKTAGINAADANGALIELADLFKSMPDGIDKTNLAVKLFGKAGMDMIPMLNLGSAGLAEAAAKAKDYGERMALMAPQADAFNDQLEELALQSKAAGINLTSYLLPGLIGMAAWMNDLAAGGERGATAMDFLKEKTSKFTDLIPQLRIMAELVERIGPALALAGVGGDQSKRSSGGRVGGSGPTLAEELALGDKNIAGMRAKDLLGKDGTSTAGKVGKTAKTDLERMLELGQRNLSASAFGGDESAFSVDTARRVEATKAAADAQKRLNDLMAATPSGQLEKARSEMEFLAAALEKGAISEQQFIEAVGMHYGNAEEKLGDMSQFAIEAARNMQDAMADGFFNLMQGKFDNMGDQLKATIDRMVANAVAADLGRRMFGDFGKTGEMGGWAKDLLGGLSGMMGGGYGDLAGVAAGVPQFAEGTPYVQRTGLALIHQGERIVPAAQNKAGFGGTINITIQGGGNAPDVRRAAGQGAREALAAFAGAKRYG